MYDLFCRTDGTNGSFERGESGDGGGGCARGSDTPGIGEVVREPAAEPTGFGGGAGGALG